MTALRLAPVLPRSSCLLLVAQSARMLAESAARAGLRTVAIDRFGDQDTLAATERCLTVPADHVGMDEILLLEAAEQLARADGHSALVYGSGIDTRPELVEKLSEGRICLGNSPQTLRLINDPAAFFELLTRLDISFPETRFSPPETPADWLIKRGCSEGGKGVRFLAKNRPAEPDEYYQKLLPGHPLSMLFLANGHDIRIVGFNTLWVNDDRPERPFEFSGAINRANLSAAQRAKVASYALALTRITGLVGLNSLDFMLEGSEIRVLEVNPRPSASLSLYDADYPNGLLAAHIVACRGGVVAGCAPAAPVRAFCIVQAPHGVRIGPSTAWPDWCADRPRDGSLIAEGEPLCSVCAEAQDAPTAEALLRDRKAMILASFDNPQGRASHSAPSINTP